MAMHHDAPTVAAQQCGLVERLREGTFGSDITKTDAYLNGLMREAATALEAQAAELAEAQQQYVDANEARIDAEAKLAEARKALGLMLREHDILSGNFGDVVDLKHRSPDRWPTAAEAARRALTGGQNG